MLDLSFLNEFIFSTFWISLFKRKNSFVDTADWGAELFFFDDYQVLLVLEWGLPVCIAFFFVFADQWAQHHYNLQVVIPYHLPEVSN